jgi:ribosomal protein S18 acetylase RimI-like enzyme
MLEELIERARNVGLMMLTLSVTVGNTAARALYRQAGFCSYGIEPDSLRVGATLFDEEMMALHLE